jgi:hypothetical protein
MIRYGRMRVNPLSAIITLLIMDWIFKPKNNRKSEYQSYLQTDHWKRVRTAVGESAGWRCEVVGCNKYGRNLNAHHFHYKSLWEEREGDVVYVCPYHHKMIHRNHAYNKKSGGVIPAFG